MKDLTLGVQRLIRDKSVFRRDQIEVRASFKAAHPDYAGVIGEGSTAQDAIDDWYIKIGTTWYPKRLQEIFDGVKMACDVWLKSAQNSERGDIVANIMEIEAFLKAFKNREFQ